MKVFIDVLKHNSGSILNVSVGTFFIPSQNYIRKNKMWIYKFDEGEHQVFLIDIPDELNYYTYDYDTNHLSFVKSETSSFSTVFGIT